MGQIRRFSCPSCNFSADVSGGEDRGLEKYTQTISCLECKNLIDVPVRKFDLPIDSSRVFPDPQARTLVGSWLKFRLGEVTRSTRPNSRASQYVHLQHYWKTVAIRCPKGPNHRVEPWFGMHLPLAESGDGAVQDLASRHRHSGGCPKCGTKMLRSQPLVSWE